MNDDLRDRIANAAGDFLSDNFHAYLEQDVALALADAVIRELDNLRYEDQSDIAGEGWGIHRRTVSDWTFIPGPDYPAEGVADE